MNYDHSIEKHLIYKLYVDKDHYYLYVDKAHNYLIWLSVYNAT